MSQTSELTLSFKTPQGEAAFVNAYAQNLALWSVPYESFYIETRFGHTHVLASGPKDAPPIVLFHGFGFSSTGWYKNIEALSKSFRTYAVDVMADVNKSVAAKPFQDKSDCALWAHDVLDALQIEKATIIGHSAGGWQTINLAVHFPERIAKLVLLAPAASFVPFHKQFFLRLLSVNLIRSRNFVINNFGRWFVAKENQDKVNESLLEQLYVGLNHFKWGRVIPPSVFKEEELRRIQVPTLLLIGDKEVIYNAKKALAQAEKTISNLQAELVPKAGHVLFIEQAELVNERMLEFLGEGANETRVD